MLERFVDLNKEEKLLADEQILRVSTDQSKVDEKLREYTVDDRVGGDINENNRLIKRAKQRVDSALLIFTTCAG